MSREIPTYDSIVTPYTAESASKDVSTQSAGHMYAWVRGTSPITPLNVPFGSKYRGTRVLYVQPANDGGVITNPDGTPAKPQDEWWTVWEHRWDSPWADHQGGSFHNFHSVPGTPGSDQTDDGVSPIHFGFAKGGMNTITPGVVMPELYLQLQGNRDNRGGQSGTQFGPNSELPHVYPLLAVPVQFGKWYSFAAHIVFGRTDGSTPRPGLIQVWIDGAKVIDLSRVNTLRLGHSRVDGSAKVQYVVEAWQGGPYVLWSTSQTPPQQVFNSHLVLARFGRSYEECLADVPTNDPARNDWGVHVSGFPDWGDCAVRRSAVQRKDTDFIGIGVTPTPTPTPDPNPSASLSANRCRGTVFTANADAKIVAVNARVVGIAPGQKQTARGVVYMVDSVGQPSKKIGEGGVVSMDGGMPDGIVSSSFLFPAPVKRGVKYMLALQTGDTSAVAIHYQDGVGESYSVPDPFGDGAESVFNITNADKQTRRYLLYATTEPSLAYGIA